MSNSGSDRSGGGKSIWGCGGVKWLVEVVDTAVASYIFLLLFARKTGQKKKKERKKGKEVQ